MSVVWRKHLESGELFPVLDDAEFEIPAHLQEAEYNSIDYEKTREVTIMELQEQLSAAQNQIKIITESPKAEPIIIENKTEIEPEDDVVHKHRDYSSIFLSAILVLLLIVVFGVFLNLKNNSNEDIPEQPQYVEEASEEEQKDELSELVEKLEGVLPIMLSLSLSFTGLRIGIKFLRSVN